MICTFIVSSGLRNPWRTMTRVIVDASGAVSASTGIRVLGSGAEWSERGRGETRFWPWSKRKSQEFARTDQYCPRTWIRLFPYTPFSLSLSSVKISLAYPVLFHLCSLFHFLFLAIAPVPLVPCLYFPIFPFQSFLLPFCSSLHTVWGTFTRLFLPL